ncbi:MAG: hypothetical protein AAF787_11320 [Chloroflexota bacterium]
MTQLDPHEVRVQDFLADLTDAQLAGNADALRLAARYDIPAAEAQALATTVNRLDVAFVDVTPSTKFRAKLRSELVVEPTAEGMVGRMRNLPPRIQIAAGVALIAAMTLLGRRRLAGEMQNLLKHWRDNTSTEGAGEVEVAAR